MTDILDDNGNPLFYARELACKATGVVNLAPGFGERLKALRLAWARPMIVTSCCRSAAHNATVDGHPRSLHVYDTPHWSTGGACAVDIKIKDGEEAGQLAFLAYGLGWSVGVPRGGFLHLDRRDIVNLRQALFGYGG